MHAPSTHDVGTFVADVFEEPRPTRTNLLIRSVRNRMPISTGTSSSAEKKDAVQAYANTDSSLEVHVASRVPSWLGIRAMVIVLEIVIFLMLIRFATYQPS